MKVKVVEEAREQYLAERAWWVENADHKNARGHKLVGKLAKRDELCQDLEKFEPWSKALIESDLVP